MELPDAVCHIVDQAGFGPFCRGLSRLTARRPLLAALVKRWWDTTDSIYLSTTWEMKMTPFNFSMLTDIGVGGNPIPYDIDMDEWDTAQMYLLDDRPPLCHPGFVRYSWFEDHFRIQAPTTREEEGQYAHGFIMFLLGTILFADQENSVALYLLSALVDVTRIRRYDWGGAGLATLYGYMSSSSRCSGHLLGGYWLAPVLAEKIPLGVPFSHRFDISWQPWAPLPDAMREQYAGARGTARFRVLLEGPVYRVWSLGEHFLH
ncbi:Protein MAIN-LIKE 2 [Camellia lanceoleosa]|uniref:Protein MAIN-LIKE 2 n=1 Tax=Camellia lanceoleosa TaxID=1840588 RepID=A0ACC0HQ11_9ERIC|nr:Protein MAIN-LIKE 2 [Camellia lanceoleosa]